MLTMSLPRRAVAGLAAAGLAASLLVAAAQPSHAVAVDVDGALLAGDENELLEALDEASASTGPVTIRLTDDIELGVSPADWYFYYRGTQDFTLDGDGHAITYLDPGMQLGVWSLSGNVGSVVVKDLVFRDVSMSLQQQGLLTIVNADRVRLENIEMDGTTSDVFGISVSASEEIVADGLWVHSSSVQRPTYGETLVSLRADVVVVENSLFEDNSSRGSLAGALHLDASTSATIRDSVFRANTSAASGGGAVFASSDTPLTIERSEFSDNAAPWRGGAILALGPLTVKDSELVGNRIRVEEPYLSPDVSGGAVYVKGDLVIERSLFAQNEAAGFGGAVYLDGAADRGIRIVSSTFDANEASQGGAVFDLYGSGSIVSSTFVGNAADSAAHVHVHGATLAASATVFADATVRWDYAHACYPYLGDVAEVISLGYNYDDDGTCTRAWSHVTDLHPEADDDPGLGTLASVNGSPAVREPVPGSRLVDAIPPDVCIAMMLDDAVAQLDQRGFDRGVFTEPGYADEGCDIGAAELPGAVEFTLDTPEGDVTVRVDGGYRLHACTGASALDDAELEHAPVGHHFPYGKLTSCVETWLPSMTVHVTMALPAGVDAVWRILGSDWEAIEDAAIEEGILTYSVTDDDHDRLISDAVVPGIEDPDATGPGDGEDGPSDGEDGPGDGEDGPGDGEDGPGDGEDGPGDGEDGPGDGEDGPGDGEGGPGDGEDGPAVVAFEIATPGGIVSFRVVGATAHLGECDSVLARSSAPAGAPSGVAIFDGIVGFCVTVEAGESVTVTATYPHPVNRAYKVGASWAPLIGAIFSGGSVTYRLTDGGDLDDDGAVNGVIRDPLAAGVAATFTG